MAPTHASAMESTVPPLEAVKMDSARGRIPSARQAFLKRPIEKRPKPVQNAALESFPNAPFLSWGMID